MDQLELVRRFHYALPALKEWIGKTLRDNRERAVPVISLGFTRLADSFSRDLLEKTKVVEVPGKVPYPPIASFGLPEFQQMESVPFSGITFMDNYFVRSDMIGSESLHFHEMVHVIQWARLGVDNFLLAYGFGLYHWGYRNSPLEEIAYSLQGRFERNDLPGRLVDFIKRETDTVWADLAPLFQCPPEMSNNFKS
jgi:hypothetical protein